MDMPYTKNPNLPKVRRQAVNLVKQGWSMRKVARYLGFNPSTISRWVKKAPADGRMSIPTKSSRPHSHPNQLDEKIIKAIVDLRLKHKRCAEVVHKELLNQGITTSLSSVKRTIKRKGLIRKRSPWKKYHISIPRPEANFSGALVQIDTIHIHTLEGEKFYVYTLIDVFSRWAYSKVVHKINTHQSLKFVKEAQLVAPFNFKMIQSDHGPEFKTWFSQNIKKLEITHRHSRVRKPNDNGHVERFNRTLKEECLINSRRSIFHYRIAIKQYLYYYNNDRLHLGINLITPIKCCQAIG